MIWRIFKKDWQLLWPLVAIVATLHGINSALWLYLGFFGEPRQLVQMTNMFEMPVLLGIAALIVTTVHQDALPGDRQDWLVRPIPRRDLVAEKILFVLLAVQTPSFLIDLLQCLATGFSFGDSLHAALTSNLYMLAIFSLPLLGLAALTANFVEAVAAFLAICILAVIIRVGVTSTLGNSNAASFVNMSGGNTMIELWSVVPLATALVVIPLQFFRRATTQARAIAFAAVFLLPLSAFIPWASAYAFQQSLSSDPAAGNKVALAYDPGLGKLTLKPGIANRADSVWLPLDVSGLAPHSIVLNDLTDVRIIGRDGKLLYSGLTTGGPAQVENGPGPVNDFSVRTESGGVVHNHQYLFLPHTIYEQVRAQPVRVELDFYLTLFHVAASDSMPALNGDRHVAGLGLCKTKMDDDGDEISVACKTEANQTCGAVVLKNTVTGKENPPTSFCRPLYLPYTAHFLPNVLLDFGGGLHFRDPQGLAKYPVDASQLANAQVLIRTYQPVAHFTRHLVIPNIRLGDWEASPAP